MYHLVVAIVALTVIRVVLSQCTRTCQISVGNTEPGVPPHPLIKSQLEHSDTLFQNLRFAFCISGELRSLALNSFQDQFFDAFYRPLWPAHIDTFFQLGDTEDAQNTTIRSRLISKFHAVYYDVVGKPPCKGKWCTLKTCSKRYYHIHGRYSMCMKAIKGTEIVQRKRYDFIIQVRPDFIFEKSLPALRCWVGLRRDIIWDSLVFFRSMKQTVANANDVLLGKDMFKILPRELSEDFMFYFSQQYQSCATQKKAEMLQPVCFTELLKRRTKATGRWDSSECFVTRAYLSMNVTVGEMHSSHRSHATRCETDIPNRYDKGKCLSVHIAPARNTCMGPNTDANTCDFYNQSLWRALPNVIADTTCFPPDAYKVKSEKISAQIDSTHW